MIINFCPMPPLFLSSKSRLMLVREKVQAVHFPRNSIISLGWRRLKKSCHRAAKAFLRTLSPDEAVDWHNPKLSFPLKFPVHPRRFISAPNGNFSMRSFGLIFLYEKEILRRTLLLYGVVFFFAHKFVYYLPFFSQQYCINMNYISRRL